LRKKLEGKELVFLARLCIKGTWCEKGEVMRMKIVSIAISRFENCEDTFCLGEDREGRPMQFEVGIIF